MRLEFLRNSRRVVADKLCFSLYVGVDTGGRGVFKVLQSLDDNINIMRYSTVDAVR